MGVKRSYERIPIPLHRRWQGFKMTVVPAVVFLIAVGGVSFIWYEHVAPPTLMGQVEPLQAQVTAPEAGALLGLSVRPFDTVQEGQAIATLIRTAPDVLEQQLAVVAAEIELIRVGMAPLAELHRSGVNYEGLRLDSMMNRVDLATAEVQLRRAESEYVRARELFEAGLASQDAYEGAEAARDALRREVAELESVIADLEGRLEAMQPPWERDDPEADAERIRAAIAVQEEQLRLVEAELRPVELTAPIDGMVSAVYKQSGEYAVAGEPLVTISSDRADRVVAYMRQPLPYQPEIGAQVQLRKRGEDRALADAEILQVGVQLEPIAPALLRSLNVFDETELGLPVLISLPQGFAARPGEIVDVILR